MPPNSKDRRMLLEAAIQDFERRYALARGKTAAPSHRDYKRWAKVRFQPCDCSRADESYRGPHGDADYFDYVGRDSEKRAVYVSARRVIRVGRRGYHNGFGRRAFSASRKLGLTSAPAASLPSVRP